MEELLTQYVNEPGISKIIIDYKNYLEINWEDYQWLGILQERLEKPFYRYDVHNYIFLFEDEC